MSEKRIVTPRPKPKNISKEEAERLIKEGKARPDASGKQLMRTVAASIGAVILFMASIIAYNIISGDHLLIQPIQLSDIRPLQSTLPDSLAAKEKSWADLFENPSSSELIQTFSFVDKSPLNENWQQEIALNLSIALYLSGAQEESTPLLSRLESNPNLTENSLERLLWLRVKHAYAQKDHYQMRFLLRKIRDTGSTDPRLSKLLRDVETIINPQFLD